MPTWSSRKYIIMTLIINGLIPWVIYILLKPHMSSLTALSIATVVPLLDNLIHLYRYRKLDVFGGIMLFTFVLSLVMVLLGGSEKLLLMRESFITAGVGVLFLGSLLMKRPLIYHMVSRFTPKVNGEKNWQYPYFRTVMRNMTLIWGVLLVLEALTKIVMIYEWSTATVLALSSVVSYGFIGLAILLTIVYRRRSAVRLRQMKQSVS
ncbi:VC0807 family protein [Paenibacillus wulumuqiensis]|uniref:VC0807 family protein n=1 Tax=Paenibacillus wulumuqiensis TaxID=1567107 RepID=UPI000619FB00|nr:VC0807 family protein [Paenibacillus wulumuqiensis]